LGKRIDVGRKKTQLGGGLEACVKKKKFCPKKRGKGHWAFPRTKGREMPKMPQVSRG